ncbi:hypothetical protein F0L68_14345 [Solihabitans fulvus]|uniref:Uncharacterized protein n=1 Tax=Solihabitans fulvus TaxID=1892852 RepID=A0A5B2XGV5_9PSEU|nr:hypothetical protein [Solihabitans fulvus]KAA2262436.1 hypothetical protein F0L68_14345 [Solihabitans fulvus]
MSTDTQETPEQNADTGQIRQIPIQVVREAPAVAAARESLLTAIGREASTVVEQQPGHSSAALVELARAFALVNMGASDATTPAAPAPTTRLLPVGRSEWAVPADEGGAVPITGPFTRFDD